VVVSAAAALSSRTGQDLIAVQTVLRRQYRSELVAGQASAGLELATIAVARPPF